MRTCLVCVYVYEGALWLGNWGDILEGVGFWGDP